MASAFAEAGLGVTKTVGDLAGPCAFALLMGAARVFYAKCSERIRLLPFMLFSTLLCIASYLLISLSSSPVLSLLGCALCGLSVGILWPGTFSIAAKEIRAGGTGAVRPAGAGRRPGLFHRPHPGGLCLRRLPG